jgi:hypothetical protein
MKDAAPAAVYLSDYTPPAWLVERVELTFRLHPTATRVLSRIVFRPNPEAADRTFRLDGETLMLVSAKIDGQPVTPDITPEGLTCAVPDAPFLWEAEVEIAPEANTALEGLYMSRGMYCTQCEAQGFRKITFYPDRPDVMAPFHVRIEGERACDAVERQPRGFRPRLGRMDRPLAQARLPLRPRRGPPRRPFRPLHHRLGPRRRPQRLGPPGRRGPLRLRDGRAQAVDALGRRGLRPRIRPRRLQHRRRRRLQHGRDGEQGAQHLQLEVCPGLPRHRDRPRLRDDRGDRRPRILPQLDRQPHHLPRLVPALPQGRAHRLPRPAVHRRPALPCGQADRGRAATPRPPVPRGQRAARPPGPARLLHRDQQLLHRHRLREGRRDHRDAQAPRGRRRLRPRARPLLRPPRRRRRHHRGLAARLRGRDGPRPRPVPLWYTQSGTPRLTVAEHFEDGRYTLTFTQKTRPPPASPKSARRSSPSPWGSSTPTATRSCRPPSSR